MPSGEVGAEACYPDHMEVEVVRAGWFGIGLGMVKEFELTDLTCQGVGRVLLNDVTSCSSDAGNRDDCVSTTRVSSRASVSLVK